MTVYANNSDGFQKSPEDEGLGKDAPPATQIVANPGKLVKPSRTKRLKRALIGTGTSDTLEDFVYDSLIPDIKALAVHLLFSGIERAVFGDSRPPMHTRPPTYSVPGVHQNGTYSNYANRFVSQAKKVITAQVIDQNVQHSTGLTTYREVVCGAKHEADIIVEKMFDNIANYGWVKVADLYSMAGISSDPTHQSWGWDELPGATIIQRHDGYLIQLPPPVPIRRSGR